MTLPNVRLGLAAGGHAHNDVLHRRATDLGCTNLYTYPNSSTTVDATLPVTFKWDTTCNVNSDLIDLYIYEPSASNALLKAYVGVTFSTGYYTAQLQPSWWNDTESVQLYVTILKNGGAVWDTTWSNGPTFTATYSAQAMYSVTTSNGVVYTSTAPGAATGTGNAVFETVNATTGKKSNKGVIAVAVIIPIVVLAGLAAVAFYFYRLKEKEKLKRWSQALSQHSAMEWEKGALPGDQRGSAYGRPSSAYSRSAGRPSTGYGRPSTGYGRPSMNSQGRPASSVMMENMAGAGTFRPFPGGAEEGPSRSSVVMADGHVRQSRISFADQVRPRLSAGDQHRPRVASGLNHDAAAAVYASGSAIDDRELTNVSPTQMDGPAGFGDAEIRRAATGTRTGRASIGQSGDVRSMLKARGSVDELRDMEAVMLMRRQTVVTHPDDTVESLHMDDDPSSPTDGNNGQPTVAYGPDQMLAVYAQRGKAASPTPDSMPSAPPLAVTKAKETVKRFLTRKGPKVPTIEIDRSAASPSPEMNMRSMVHMHNGTASGQAVDSLPAPGPH